MKLFEVHSDYIRINISKSKAFIFIFSFTFLISVNQMLIYQNLYAITSYLALMLMSFICFYKMHTQNIYTNQIEYYDDLKVVSSKTIKENEFLLKKKLY